MSANIENNDLITPIILAGGRGARLWPISRLSRPKQFLPLFNGLSLFQQTLIRINDESFYEKPIILTNIEHQFLVVEQAAEMGIEPAAIIVEPAIRNTAPAIIAASLIAAKDEKDKLIHILPSDHIIKVDNAYLNALKIAKQGAKNGYLVTFGIKPNRPETGFGYIKARKIRAHEIKAEKAYLVEKFIEKPNLEKARKMLFSGDYYWNSGMFLFSSDVFLHECKKITPKIFTNAKRSVKQAQIDYPFIKLEEKSFLTSPPISIDKAIFEKTKLAAIVPSPIEWDDLGSWESVWRNKKRGKNNNLQIGSATISNSKNSLIFSEKTHIVVDGVDNIAIIASEDVVYVGNIAATQHIGNIVEKLGNNSKTAPFTQRSLIIHKEWGNYSIVLDEENLLIKRLFIKPGKDFPLREKDCQIVNLFVVRGTAKLRLGEKIITLNENKTASIEQGLAYNIYNPGKSTLEIIIMQINYC